MYINNSMILLLCLLKAAFICKIFHMATGFSLSDGCLSYSQFCLWSQSSRQICVALHLYHPFQNLVSCCFLSVLFIFQVGFFSGRKRESIFKSPEDPHGKVGVTGSGKGLTDFQKREKHLHLKGANAEGSDEQMLVPIPLSVGYLKFSMFPTYM